MDLSNLQYAEGSKQSGNFRRGRGHGSGNGKTAGKGHKGQKARSGAPRPGFEGGQMPLYRRLPKRGFTNRNSKVIVGINVSALEVFENDAVVSVETLLEQGIVKNPKDGVKILGNGELTKKFTCLLYTSMAIGCKVTLRGEKMYEFADRLINLALPRVRDFRGVNPNAFDGRGNYALGIKEQLIFPEIEYDKVDKVRGMDVIFVTTAKPDEEARELLTLFNMPFTK